MGVSKEDILITNDYDFGSLLHFAFLDENGEEFSDNDNKTETSLQTEEQHTAEVETSATESTNKSDENGFDTEKAKDNFAYVNNGKLMLSGISDNAQIDVYDFMGRRVLCDVVNGTNETYTIEMNGVQTGLYIVKVSDKEGIKMQKIIL